MNRESRQCVECRIVRLEMNGAWKGGKTTHHAGYVMVRVPDHPRAQNNGGYVFEHILVMEDLLGRFLVPGETVHHRNGVKDDNRQQNLELWTRPQPSGIRAVDAVVHSLSTLLLYAQDVTVRLNGDVLFGAR